MLTFSLLLFTLHRFTGMSKHRTEPTGRTGTARRQLWYDTIRYDSMV